VLAGVASGSAPVPVAVGEGVSVRGQGFHPWSPIR
jgi:hypothetical protein